MRSSPPSRRRPRHPARRTRRAVGAASVAGFAAIGGAVALGTGATASPENVSPPTTAPASSGDDAGATTPWQDGRSSTPPWQQDGQASGDRRAGPVAGADGAPSPDTSSHGS